MKKINSIERICKKYKIALVYLFGSQKEKAFEILTGKKVEIFDPLADIDVGVVFIGNIEKIKEKYRLYADIYNEFVEIFSPYSLDLVFLQECHSVFQMEAIQGLCIYKISEEFKEKYEMMVLRRGADFKYVLDKYYEEALEEY